MKWGKNLIGLVVAVILGLSLFLAPVVNRVSPTQAAVTWRYPVEVTLDNELYAVDAWVIRESTTSYKMWYTHGKKDLSVLDIVNDITAILTDDIITEIANLDLEQFLNHLGGLDVGKLKDLLDGTSTVIGYATSTNGRTWTKVNSEVLAGSGAAWDSVGAPCVIKESDTSYKMWYTRIKTDLTQASLETILTNMGTAQRKDALLDLLNSTRTVIEYTTSSDGVGWGVPQEVLAGSGAAWDSVGAPCVIKESDTSYKMWYTRIKKDLTEADLDALDIATFNVDDLLGIFDGTSTVIGYATSSNGVDWGVPQQVLAGDGPAWDSVADPSVIKTGGSYEMWYTNGETDLIKANLITLLDEIAGLANSFWNILEAFTTGDFEALLDELNALNITTLKDLLDDTSTVIGYATSSDGITWTVKATPDLVGSSGSPWSSVAAPSVVKTGSTYQMWYTEGIDDLSVGDLLALVLGTDLPIGYAYYTPPAPPPSPPEEEVTAEDIEEMTTEEATEAVEEMTTEEAADIIEEITIETAAAIIEEITTETAADIIEEIATETAADIIEEITTDTAADIIEEVTIETAADIIEEVAIDTAVDIIEEITTDTAADIIEEVATDTAADILEGVVVEKAAAIMEELTTAKLTETIPAMSETSLTERLPGLSADKLYSIEPAVLFESLPNAPTEQLVSEEPPEPPPELGPPVVVYTTPTGVKYLAIRTMAGEWVVVMGSPMPVDKLMIKTKPGLTDVATTIEVLEELPSGVVGLPVGQIVSAYLSITFENATPEDIELGHMTFTVEKEWLEQNSIHKWSVALSRYDLELGQWLPLSTKRLREDDTYVYYTVVITRFSIFAISGSRVVPPLEFEATNLVINPLEAGTGQAITISADITNLSNTAGTYAVILWIDGTVEAGKDVSLEADETTLVSFTVIRDVAGGYQVRLDRLFGSFNVIKVIKAPAAFVVSDLSITPAEVDIGETVTISVLITNTGDLAGSYEVTLKIDNVVVATKKVTLAGGASQRVTFTTAKDVARTYAVTVDGLSGTFVVRVPPPPPPKPIDWWLIGGIIAGVIIIGVLIWQVIIRRRV